MLFYPKKVSETKLITRDVSMIVYWLGFLMFIPMAVALMYGEPNWWMYLFTFLITSGPSYLFIRYIKKTEAPFTRMTILTLAVSWICFATVGAYPFIFVGGMHPLDSYFESVSAISTTGVTTIPNPELGYFPQSVLFWRAMISWLGGLGITAFAFYTLMQYESVSKVVLGEGYGHLKPSLVNSAKEIFKIYGFWTVAGIAILMALGFPLLDSFNLSMNAVSTTGFDVHSGGWAYYQQNMPQTFPIMVSVVTFLTLMGAISFIVHYRVIKNRRIRMYFQDSETRLYLAILAIGVILVASYMLVKGLPNAAPMAYEAISASTGGYEMSLKIADSASGFVLAVLYVLVLIGGSSNSAAGGIKVSRVYLLIKYVLWKVGQQISPEGSVSHFRHGGKAVDTEEVATIAVYVFIYSIAILVVTEFMIACEYDVDDSLMTVASMQAGAGISPMPGWELVWPVKLALIFTMLFGRLEFIPFFALAMYILKRK